MLFDRFIFVVITLLFALDLSGSEKQLLDSAWSELINNNPLKAKSLFWKTSDCKDSKQAAEAYRGLGIVESFLGNNSLSGQCFLDAYCKDGDLSMFSSRPGFQMSEVSDKNKENKKRDKVFLNLASSNGLFNGWYQDALLQRYLNAGQLKNAVKQKKKMGAITEWQFIGPFENVSNCGFAAIYPPENEINSIKEYEGKSGNTVRWHKLQTLTPNGWMFTDNYTAEENAVYYFNCKIISLEDQQVFLSFGASGVFKVFLNGNTVLMDSVFRNTGIDAYIQKVKLNKGENNLLVKIGHETANTSSSLSGYANFMLRFLDKKYNPLNNIRAEQTETASYKLDTTKYSYLAPSPVLDSISAVLNRRLQIDSTSFDALFALVSLYNIYERTNDAQLIVQKYLAKYPNSSILYSQLAESLIRARKNIEYEIAMKKAFDLCNLNRSAWSRQLRIIMGNGNPRTVIEFLTGSPELFQKSPESVIAYLSAALQQKNDAEALKRISELETGYADDPDVMNFLVTYYISQGTLQKAIDMLTNYTEKNHTASDVFSQIASIEIKQGNLKKGIESYLNAISFNPSYPYSYLNLAVLYYNRKQYNEALRYTDKSLSITPASSVALNLKGNILESMGRSEDALKTFLQTVKYTPDDFNAWEKIRTLKKQKSFEELSVLPDIDSLKNVSSSWLKSVQNRAALLSYIEDVYLYPSRCSSTRTFMVVHLPNQNEIDLWKEYRIPFNPNYQLLNIEKAVSRKSNGTEINADHEDNFIVFKSLEPGDLIILEYSLKNYYEGAMAGKVYGVQNFQRGISSFDTRLRLIAPVNDTIPYTIVGDSITVINRDEQDYRITTITSKPFSADNPESFCPSDFPTYQKTVYSNFNDWGQICNWYYEISRHKQNQTIELKTVADSILRSCSTDWEKTKSIHKFITKNINYSYVPFRQSGWVPQAAKDVLATRIGDCKDMASLGKCFMDIAGIKSWLVLVNTGIHNFTDNAFIGPNFDHCILQFELGDKEYYVDFTDKNTAPGGLPSADQGAMALVIKPGNNKITLLPIDTPEKRIISRKIEMVLDTNGTLKQTMKTIRSGIFASQLRSIYRFKDEKQQNSDLHHVLSREYQEVKIDSLWFEKLDTITDSMSFNYTMVAKNAADINGSTIIYSLRLPDVMGPGYYPIERDRKNPVDLSSSSASIAKLNLNTELVVPENWVLVDKPQDITINTENMKYNLNYKFEKGKIVINRSFISNYNRIFGSKEFTGEQDALMRVAKSDDVKLIFKKK